jgi:Integrase core domain
MAAHGIVGHRPRRRRGLTKPNTAEPPAPDLVGRLFDPDQLDRSWVSDLTYIPSEKGWLDLASRHLLGWSMGQHHNAGLVGDALDAAVATRGRARLDGTIFHTDRGSESTSTACIEICERLGLRRSMAAPARAWTTRSPSPSSPPSRSSSSTEPPTAPGPRHGPRSSAGSPGTTNAGCTPPTTTCRPSSGNSSIVTTTH